MITRLIKTYKSETENKPIRLLIWEKGSASSMVILKANGKRQTQTHHTLQIQITFCNVIQATYVLVCNIFLHFICRTITPFQIDHKLLIIIPNTQKHYQEYLHKYIEKSWTTYQNRKMHFKVSLRRKTFSFTFCGAYILKELLQFMEAPGKAIFCKYHSIT